MFPLVPVMGPFTRSMRALITGGRGHYLGMLGGVLLLTALQVLLDGTTLPFAVRDILFGAVVLSAVVALRDSKS